MASSATQTRVSSDSPGVSAQALELHSEFANRSLFLLDGMDLADYRVEICQGRNSVWLLMRRGEASVAFRTAYSFGQEFECKITRHSEDVKQYELVGAFGVCKAVIKRLKDPRDMIRVTVSLLPAEDFLLTFWPRDIYPLGPTEHPSASEGEIIAAQRGINTGLTFAALKSPEFGTFLYSQDLTQLNDFFEATSTKPDGAVGGEWPELGYLVPTSDKKPLQRGKEVVISDYFVAPTPNLAEEPQDKSALFVELLASMYLHFTMPETPVRNWPQIARKAKRSLAENDKIRERYWGCLYLRPYLDAEYPDSMTQMNIVTGLREYSRWLGKPVPLADELWAGMTRFYDGQVEFLGRYLSNVGKDKDPFEVDTWYLFHPLANLARMAMSGHEGAHRLLLKSIPFVLKVGRRFDYQFPVMFDARSLEPKKMERSPGQPGQSDSAGLYAYLMAQMEELTGDSKYIDEAEKAIRKVSHLGFDLPYQLNITAWAIAACIRLFQRTGDEFYRRETMNYGAGFFHNCLIWESNIAHAKHYLKFLGASSLHDGPYMSMFECHESYEAFSDALKAGRDDLPEPLRLLMSDYIRYVLSRAWFYYPAHLPKEAVATQIRNGHIDSKLALPLEDLYGDGQPAGQVGQEVYGASAPFAFIRTAFIRLKRVPFILFGEHPLVDVEFVEAGRARGMMLGTPKLERWLYALPSGRKRLPKVEVVSDASRVKMEKVKTDLGDAWRGRVRSGSPFEVTWE